MNNITPEQTQAAKDFIWKYLADHNKELVLSAANTNILTETDLVVREIFIGFSYEG